MKIVAIERVTLYLVEAPAAFGDVEIISSLKSVLRK